MHCCDFTIDQLCRLIRAIITEGKVLRIQAANEAMREALSPEDLQQYAILGRDTDFEAALPDGSVPASGIVNVKSQGERKSAETGNKRQREGKMYQKGGKNQKSNKAQDKKHSSKKQRS